MEKEFVTYEIASALKELGFDEPCLAVFSDDECCDLIHVCENQTEGNFIIESFQYGTKAPLWQQALIWFREKYKIHIVINISIIYNWYFELYNLNDKRNAEIKTNQNEFKTYEEAELACLIKLIEIVKNGNKS